MTTFLCLSLTIAIVVAGSVADAQQMGKVARIGFLDPSTASGSAVLWEVFRQELSKLGWIESKNVVIEYRLPSKSPSACPSLLRS